MEAFNRVSRDGLEWTWNRRAGVGVAVVFLCAAFGAAALLPLRKRAAPILLLLAAIALASWGQVLLLGKILTPAGIGFYLAGILGAAFLGWLRPMARLPGFPTLPSLTEDPPKGKAAVWGMPPSEWAIVLGFTLAGLLFRGYALTENPSAFEGETLPMMLGSYTAHGLRYYLTTEFLGTGNGIFHALTHYVFFRLLGASIFTIRLVSVFWGVLAIPLLYGLARRIAGRGAASVAAALFITAPEQLCWSRSDNTFFPPVAVLAIVTAHLCLSLQERFTLRAAAAAALGMVACRYFYTPSWVLFTLPLLLAAHAAFFVRGAFARLRFVAPVLLGGLLLWAVGLSVVEYAASAEHQWQLVPAWTVKGESAWRAGIPNQARPAEVLARQTARVATNAGYVLAGMTRHAKYTTHWYSRYYVDSQRQTTIAVGLAVLAALGIGYLLGQFRDRRSALLLFWIAIGLLPGCLSDQPEARRISLAFPALPIVAAVFAAAGVRICRQAAGRLGARIAAAAVGVAVAATAWAGLASNALLPTERPRFDVVRRFAEPMLSRCDVVLHNVFAVSSDVVQIGSLDTRIGSGPGRCTEFVHEKDWPVAALDPRCDFDDPVFQLTLPEEEIAARRDSLRPKRIGYLLTAAPESRAHVELLRRLYPSAPVKELPGETPEESLFAIEVPFAEIAALRSPEKSSQPGGARATIEGGMLLTERDWYRFRLEPECPGAELAAGTPPS
ncbi:MAG TPA: glycosyltransferase family 39 protein, partial [Thermoanaerobaculia bacterium]|nr:glycosyltransferase family 39 protein [Thermoanaerobaculia bacterium]